MIVLPSFENQDFGQFIVAVYNLAIGLVGFAVFLQFTWAGLTYLLAAGNMAEVGKAKDKMRNAVVGAILLLSSYLILNVINPDLVNVKLFNLDDVSKNIKNSQPGNEVGNPRTGDQPSQNN